MPKKKMAPKKMLKQKNVVVTKLFVAAVLMLLAFVLFDLVDKRLKVIKSEAALNKVPATVQIDRELKVIDTTVKGSSTSSLDDKGLNEKALGL